jgi:GTPase SAR1 family protein
MMMVGPDGVGKTTLLATMYHELSNLEDDDNDDQSGFELVASQDTHHDLQEAYQKLTTIVTQPTFTPTGPLLKGTAGLIERQFEMVFKGKKELDLVFCDIAGGIIQANEGNRDFDEFKTRLEQAVVIINVIDGSALVEGNDSLSAKKNNPRQIEKLLQPILTNPQNHLLLFVITKCEAWLKNEKTQTLLERAFEKQYEMMLKWLKHVENVVAVLIPVKTLGCVEFTRIDSHGDEQEMVFIRKPNLRFCPENTDQPLRYALAFALLQHNQNRSQWNQFVRWIFNEDVAFQKALTEFAQGRSQTFKIYGNSSLIEVTK